MDKLTVGLEEVDHLRQVCPANKYKLTLREYILMLKLRPKELPKPPDGICAHWRKLLSEGAKLNVLEQD